MKTIIISMFLFILLCATALNQTTKQKPTAASNNQSHQTFYFRGYGPCNLTNELNEKEIKSFLDCISNDTSLAQIRYDFDHPDKKLAPLVKKLSDESKSCILKTAKFSLGPKSCPEMVPVRWTVFKRT